MEGVPTLTCLIQHTLRGLCSSSSSSSSKWVYAVFWKILPRVYPPPKEHNLRFAVLRRWDYGGGIIDRAKGNKRNWILVWEDGYCDLEECDRRDNKYDKGIFGARIFFKLSHEVYNFGEGLIGKVAADNGHKWVFEDGSNEKDPSFMSSWNASIDPQPKAWDYHFNSGIKTIAIISVRDGIIQLGSFDKILEDLNLVISIQRKFSYLQSIPEIYSIQRPFLTVQHHPYNTLKHNNYVNMGFESNEVFSLENDKKAQQLIGPKRVMVNICGQESPPNIGPIKLGYNTPENGLIGSDGPPLWPIPPLLPSQYFKPRLEHVDPTRIGNHIITQCTEEKVSQDPGQKRKLDCLIGVGPIRKTDKKS